jgi:hypothetical protein
MPSSSGFSISVGIGAMVWAKISFREKRDRKNRIVNVFFFMSID